MIDLRTAKALRGLLIKALELLDTSIKQAEQPFDSCYHADRMELNTMGRGKSNRKTYLCGDCGAQFEEEVEDEQPRTLGRSGIRPGSPGGQTTGEQAGT